MRQTNLTRALFVLLVLCATDVAAQSLRGPLNESLRITPTEASSLDLVDIESITTIELGGDLRFYDAVEIEITSPSAVAEFPGAVSVYVLGPVNLTEDANVANVAGPQLLEQPLVRAGKTFYQLVLRDDAAHDASPAVVRIGDTVPSAAFPIAISMVTRMKGLSQELSNAQFSVSARAVPRDIGSIGVSYPLEDGTAFDPEGPIAPDFALFLDGDQVDPSAEFLLAPGLHRLRLVSDRFEDQEVTVGVERGASQRVDLPLNLALATVSYSAPRGATVFVDGELVPGSSGDFTVPPGDHTIVVVVGDYTVTRRFSVDEKRTYSIAVTMDIAVEELN